MKRYLIMAVMVFSILQGCSRVEHYRNHHDCKSLYSVLYQQVKEGDSKEKVQKLLGLGIIPSDQEKEKLLSAVKKVVQKYPQGYPQGLEDTDEFLGYGCGTVKNGCGGETLYLQFRDGKLINHTPEDFTKYEPAVLLSLPPEKLR